MIRSLLRRRSRAAGGGGGGGSGFQLDAAALPLASRQVTDWTTHRARLTGTGLSRGIERGVVFTDRITGARVLSLGSGQLDYSEAGPSFSASDVDGGCYVVWNNGADWVVGSLTYNATTPTITNVRVLVARPGLDTAHAFSQNPATPFYLYVLTSAFVLQRIDVRTNTLASSGLFPKTLTAGLTGSSAPAWLTVSDNDTRFGYQRAQGESAGVWIVATDTIIVHDIAWFEARAPYGFRFDEVHLSDSGRYMAVLGGIYFAETAGAPRNSAYGPSPNKATIGSWSVLSGSVYQCTATLGTGSGLRDVFRTNAGGATLLQVLAQRANGTTALDAGEWSVDAASGGTQVLRVRMTDGSNPATFVAGFAALVSEPMCWWDVDTDRQSASVLPQGTQMTHVAWQGDVLHAANPGGNTSEMVKATPVPITADGQVVSAPTSYANTALTSVSLQHSCAMMVLTGRVANEQYIVGADLPPFSEATLGTWTVLSGSVYQSTGSLTPYLRYLIGIRDVVLINASREHLQTLTRRADGTTALAAGEWSVDAVSGTDQVVRVRLPDGTDPAGKVLAYPPRLNHFTVGAVRADGAEVRVIMEHHSYGWDANAYAEYPKSQIQRDGLWCATNTNHGIPGGRIDVLVAQLPRVAR